MPKLSYLLWALTIFICDGCSVQRTGCYSGNERYLIFEDPDFGPNCKIYVSFQTLFKEFEGAPKCTDCAATFEYIKNAQTNVEVNTVRFQTEDGSPALTNLMLVNFLDARLVYLLKNGLVLIYNTKENKWEEKYYIRYNRSPFGGEFLYVKNVEGEVLFSVLISIG